MGYLLPALTDAKFENQRDVVLNERRQNYENRPYGLARMVARRRRSIRRIIRTTGRRSARSRTCSAAHLDDVRAFFQHLLPPGATRRSRSPATSTPTRALALARAYFGDLAAGPAAAAGRRPATAARRRDAPRARGSRRAAAALPGVAFAGDVRATTMPSSISRPTCSPTARRRGCTAALVYEQRIATDVSAVPELARDGRLLPDRRDGRARPDARRDRARPSRASSRGCAPTGPTADEMERGLAQAEAQFMLPPADRRRLRRQVRSVERLQRVPRRPRLLRARPGALSPGRRREAACGPRRAWLADRAAVALSVVPHGRADLALPGSSRSSVS